MNKILNFNQVLEECGENKIHLLLGNGFSRACKNDIFSYKALMDEADFSTAPNPGVKDVFDSLATSDFEHVMRSLRIAAKITPHYTKEKLSKRMNDDANALKEILVRTISQNHPSHPSEITDEQYVNCRKFISKFKTIYTLNYDLLLYWALMKDGIDELDIKCDDGFRNEEDNPFTDYVVWEPENSRNQNIHYLHGALHLYEDEDGIKKFTWTRTGIKLKEQILNALNQGSYPIYVSEGTAKEKKNSIRHNEYLARVKRSFISIGGILVVYGNSLSDADNHIVEMIHKNNVEIMYVGLFGDPDEVGNKTIIKKTQGIGKANKKKNLIVKYFDSKSVKIW